MIRFEKSVKGLELICRPVGYEVLRDSNNANVMLSLCPISARLEHVPKICGTTVSRIVRRDPNLLFSIGRLGALLDRLA